MKRIFIITFSLVMCGAQLHGAAWLCLVPWKHTPKTQESAYHLVRYASCTRFIRQHCTNVAEYTVWHNDAQYYLNEARQPNTDYGQVIMCLEADLGCFTRSLMEATDPLFKRQLHTQHMNYTIAIQTAKKLSELSEKMLLQPAVDPEPAVDPVD